MDWGGYPAVFALMLLETMFPPMPSEVILPLAGYRVAHGPNLASPAWSSSRRSAR